MAALGRLPMVNLAFCNFAAGANHYELNGGLAFDDSCEFGKLETLLFPRGSAGPSGHAASGAGVLREPGLS